MTSAESLTRAFRDDRAAVLATLVRYTGDLQIAEDAVQDAFADALAAWARDGTPTTPRAWLMTAARRRAIDRIRRDRSVADRARRLGEIAAIEACATDDEPDEEVPVIDDRLRLIFTCCHPALNREAQIALTLRTLGGLTTGEIARAFLVAEPTMGKRIVRAKRKIADARIPYRVPSEPELPARLGAVLQVIYLIFNEGYASSSGDALVRGELCAEAIRLGRLIAELMPDEADVWGLVALMELHDARRGARVDAAGRWVGLDDQDVSSWDGARIAGGLRALDRSLALGHAGSYQLQAAITALHIRGAADGEVDWAAIAELYAALERAAPSPVVSVNRAAAVAFADGPEAGFALLRPLLDRPELASYQPFHALHAELLTRTGKLDGAARAYERAIELSANEVERAELRARRARLGVSS